MKKLDYTCNIDPINYDYSAQDTIKHLYFKDYKHLKNVDWGVDKPKTNYIMESLALIIAFASIIAVLFLSEV